MVRLLVVVALLTLVLGTRWPADAWRWILPEPAQQEISLAPAGHWLYGTLRPILGTAGLLVVPAVLALMWATLLLARGKGNLLPYCLLLLTLPWLAPLFAPGAGLLTLIGASLLLLTLRIERPWKRWMIIFFIQWTWMHFDPCAPLGLLLVIAALLDEWLSPSDEKATVVDHLGNVSAALGAAILTIPPVAVLAAALDYLLLPVKGTVGLAAALPEYVPTLRSDPLAGAVLVATALLTIRGTTRPPWSQIAILLTMGLTSLRDTAVSLGILVFLNFDTPMAVPTRNLQRGWSVAAATACLVFGFSVAYLKQPSLPHWWVGSRVEDSSLNRLRTGGVSGPVLMYPLQWAAKEFSTPKDTLFSPWAAADHLPVEQVEDYLTTVRRLRDQEDHLVQWSDRPLTALHWTTDDLPGIGRLATSTDWRPVYWDQRFVTFLTSATPARELFQSARQRVQSLNITAYLESETKRNPSQGRPLDQVLYALRLTPQALRLALLVRPGTPWVVLYAQTMAQQDRRLCGHANPLWYPLTMRGIRDLERLQSLPPAMLEVLASFAVEENYLDHAAQLYQLLLDASDLEPGLQRRAQQQLASIDRQRNQLDRMLRQATGTDDDAETAWQHGFPMTAQALLMQHSERQAEWDERFLLLGSFSWIRRPHAIALANAVRAVESGDPQEAERLLTAAMSSNGAESLEQRQLAFCLFSVSLLTGNLEERNRMASRLKSHPGFAPLVNQYSQFNENPVP